MPHRFASHLRAVAVISALALAFMVTLTAWGAARAQDASPSPSVSGCAKASTTKGDPAGTPVADANCVEVDMHDIYFGANLITIPADTDVTFVIHNYGAASHNFVVSDHNNKDVKNLDIKVEENAGTQSEVKINAPAGTYYFYCDIPGHEQAGMWGLIKVEKDAKISAQSVDNPKEA